MRTGSLKWSHVSFVSAVLLLGFVAVTAFSGAAKLIDGDFLNSYPFTYSDSFDWYYEGSALAEVVEGYPLRPLPVLRDPLPVALYALDSLFRSNGILVLILNALAFVGTGWILLKTLRSFFPESPVFAAAILFAVQSLNFFYLYVLADPFGIFLSIALYGYFAKLVREDRWSARDLSFYSVILIAGVLCRHYCAIPAVAMGMAVAMLRPGRVLRFGVAIGSALLVAAGISWLWRQTPHGSIPKTYGFLKPQLNQLRLYVPIWVKIALPFAPVLASIVFVLVRSRENFYAKRDPLNLMLLALFLSVGAHALLSVLYQWVDMRFTWIYLAQALLLILLVLHKFVHGRLRLIAIYGAAFLCVLAAGFREEKIHEIRLATFSTNNFWAHRPRLNGSVDRLDARVQCSAVSRQFCPEMSTDKVQGLTPYQRAILSNYLPLVMERRRRN